MSAFVSNEEYMERWESSAPKAVDSHLTPEQIKKVQGTRNSDAAPWENYMVEQQLTPEMEAAVARIRRTRKNVIWIQKMLPKPDVIELYSHAAVFCCPSIYEPFGIINVEAMACGAPVVASATGGIPEVVVPGKTGLLVGLKPRQDGTYEPKDARKFSRDLAAAINRILRDPMLQKRFACEGRRRVEAHFSWAGVARKTLQLYRSLV